MSEKDDGIRSAVTSANLPDLRTDRVDGNRQEVLSLSAQVSHSASSASFVPRNSLSPQQEQSKKALSASDAALPTTLHQQQANKKSLSAFSPSFDPSWRQKLGRSPALPSGGSTITSTSRLTAPRDCYSARGDMVAMMPGGYHGSVNTMQSNGVMPPPPMFMPGYDMPMMGIPGQVYPTKQAELTIVAYLGCNSSSARSHTCVLTYTTNTLF